MNRRLCLLILLAVSPCLARSKTPPPLPPADPGVHVEAGRGGTRIDVRLTGTLLSVAAPRRSDGVRELFLLTAALPEGVPATLERTATSDEDSESDEGSEVPVVPAALCEEPDRPDSVELRRLRFPGGSETPELELIRSDLPLDAASIEAVELDGDGVEELVLIRPGELLRVPPGATDALVSLIHDPALAVAASGASIFHRGDDGPLWVLVSDIGRSRFYRSVTGSGTLTLVGEVGTPTSVSLGPEGTRIHGTALMNAGTMAQGHPRFATTPSAIDGKRVRIDLIDPLASAVDAETESEPETEAEEEVEAGRTECWAALPDREQPLERFVRELDGEPVAILTTIAAGKLSVFGEKRIRILPLRGDRTRAGHAPIFATVSRMNLWQMVVPYFRDVDADGLTDLVLGYWKGLKDHRVVLDVYAGNPAGGFSNSPKSTAFNVVDGNRSGLIYGEDVTGDGISDLILRGGGKLQVFSGSPGLSGIVARKPSRSISLGWSCQEGPLGEITIGVGAGQGGMFHSLETTGGSPPPRLVDLDGDGRSEVLLTKVSECGAGRLQLFFLAADSPS